MTARRSSSRSRRITRGFRCASSVSGSTPTALVQADVFLLTDDRPQLLAGGPGLALERSQPASPQLLDDLRSDQNMGWVPDSQWLSYVKVDATAGDLHYDLATSVDRNQRPSLVDAGLTTSRPPRRRDRRAAARHRPLRVGGASAGGRSPS